MKILSLLSLLVVIPSLLIGCDSRAVSSADYQAIHQSGIKQLSFAQDMQKLFGVTDHFITHLWPSDEAKTWNSECFLFGRYILTATIDVRVDWKKKAVNDIQGNNPKFYLEEIRKVTILPDGRPSADIEGQREFGFEEWKKLVEAKGDFAKIGINVKKADPVEHFNALVSAVRKDRIVIKQ